MRNSPSYEIIIVGGGAAGLSAALTLGRCLRSVLVCDAGQPRNARATLFNGFLSRDNSTPSEFLEICRKQLARYETVELRKVLVVDATRNDDGFAVTLEDGETLSCRLLLLATGLVDELPRIEGFLPLYGRSIHSCPHCHGWEVRGKAIGVLGGNQLAADLAIELGQWSKDILLFTNGPSQYDAKAAAQMRKIGIPVVESRILRFEGDDGSLSGVRLADSGLIKRDAMFFSPTQRQNSDLAEKLGCEFCEEGACIQCDISAATCIPGLWAAGNASRGVQLVIAAAAEGTLAAVAMNNALVECDAAGSW